MSDADIVDRERIALLDNRVANQIAAGEVVERPASVVKELLENSIDSGASRIEVDIERGGARLIRVTDNGKGIHQDDLALALTRHATSKIRSTQDLAQICSLGFRGEALASISSVSRLTLTSRMHDVELAWQAVAHGRDMAVDVQPAAAAAGTRIEVADLFFNTPARQKFLRTEKTEFWHIEEVFKQHALANFGLSFMLKHNGKVVKRAPACGDKNAQIKRIATICGKPFADNAIAFECQHELLSIHGWLGHPSFHRSESDIQYVFINHRPVKDKTLNHAIRQAYEGMLPPGRMATYVVYLTVNPAKVDVNVHPTKHEVRFEEQRLIHDLLAKSMQDALNDSIGGELFDANHNLSEVSSHESSSIRSYTPALQSRAAESDELPIQDKNFTKTSDTKRHIPSSFASSRHAAINSYHSRNNEEKIKASFDYLQQIEESPSAYSGEIDKAGSTALSDLERTSLANTSKRQENNQFSLLTLDKQYLLLQLNSPDSSTVNFIINFSLLLEQFFQLCFQEKIEVTSQALLFPESIELQSAWLEDCANHEFLAQQGFLLEPEPQTKLKIRKIPTWLNFFPTANVLNLLNSWFKKMSKQDSKLAIQSACFASLLDTDSTSFSQEICLLMLPFLKQSHAVVCLDKSRVQGLFDEN